MTSHSPFGSERDGKKLVTNDGEAAVIDRIMALRAAAKSFGKIADELNRAEIPTKRGCTWSAMQVQRIVNRAA